jgi:hypothetical protein
MTGPAAAIAWITKAALLMHAVTKTDFTVSYNCSAVLLIVPDVSSVAVVQFVCTLTL